MPSAVLHAEDTEGHKMYKVSELQSSDANDGSK